MGKTSIDRTCPKCGGNIIIDRDYHGWYEQCLQCSFMRDLKVIYQKKAAEAAPGENREEPARVA
jgi:ssDNA-binding Zn-finger/Zn-ribbon topoisomerase 1